MTRVGTIQGGVGETKFALTKNQTSCGWLSAIFLPLYWELDHLIRNIVLSFLCLWTETSVRGRLGTIKTTFEWNTRSVARVEVFDAKFRALHTYPVMVEKVRNLKRTGYEINDILTQGIPPTAAEALEVEQPPVARRADSDFDDQTIQGMDQA